MRYRKNISFLLSERQQIYRIMSKTNIALLCIVAMFAGFLFSRAILSMAVIAFGVNALWDIHPRRWLQQRWWLLGVGWVAIYALSYFWSDDKSLWGQRLEVKLPILLLPLAFSFLPSFTQRQLQIYTAAIGLLLLGGVVYSLSFLFTDPEHYVKGYYMSQVLPTPVYRDHIRFSVAIALYVVWCGYFWRYAKGQAFKWLMAALVIILSIYLHILAARTGLLIWYMFLMGYAIYRGLKHSRLTAIVSLVLVAVFAVLAVIYVPTLNKRWRYVYYTYELYTRGQMSGLYSDLGRLISYDVATHIIAAHPLAGVGSGDMMAEMKDSYAQLYPQITDEQVLLPHNQFLIVAMAGGLIAVLLFLAWVLYPLQYIRKNRNGFYFLIVWLALLLPLLIEPLLEVQFGVFVYLFFLLWHRHALLHPPVEKT